MSKLLFIGGILDGEIRDVSHPPNLVQRYDAIHSVYLYRKVWRKGHHRKGEVASFWCEERMVKGGDLSVERGQLLLDHVLPRIPKEHWKPIGDFV